MHLAGQAIWRRDGQRGYAMAALLVGLSIMAVMLTAVMPVWKQTSRREKETELIFRGTQYAHAIGLFQRKFANAYPPNIDALVEQRFLRKKFKDPITNDDFAPILAGQGVPASQQPSGARGGTGSTSGGGRSTQPGLSTSTSSTQPSSLGRSAGPQLSANGQTSGGIQGVTSKSKDQSIRLYNGRGHYNEWQFVYVQQQQAPGAVGAGQGAPGPGGQRGQQPGPPGSGGTQPGGRGGRGPFGPNGPGGRGGPFGGGGATPIQPPSIPRGRF